jgi:hypothetical protein
MALRLLLKLLVTPATGCESGGECAVEMELPPNLDLDFFLFYMPLIIFFGSRRGVDRWFHDISNTSRTTVVYDNPSTR